MNSTNNTILPIWKCWSLRMDAMTSTWLIWVSRSMTFASHQSRGLRGTTWHRWLTFSLTSNREALIMILPTQMHIAIRFIIQRHRLTYVISCQTTIRSSMDQSRHQTQWGRTIVYAWVAPALRCITFILTRADWARSQPSSTLTRSLPRPLDIMFE